MNKALSEFNHSLMVNIAKAYSANINMLRN